ncbi:unnamed protein product, partial [Choristocarpus tenellus]
YASYVLSRLVRCRYVLNIALGETISMKLRWCSKHHIYTTPALSHVHRTVTFVTYTHCDVFTPMYSTPCQEKHPQSIGWLDRRLAVQIKSTFKANLPLMPWPTHSIAFYEDIL